MVYLYKPYSLSHVLYGIISKSKEPVIMLIFKKTILFFIIFAILCIFPDSRRDKDNKNDEC